MTDPYLEAMMHGKFIKGKSHPSSPPHKSPCLVAAEKEIIKHIESLDLDTLYAHNRLVSASMKKAQLKEEMTRNILFDDLTSQLSLAFNALLTLGKQTMNPDIYRQWEEKLYSIPELYDQISPDHPIEPPQTLLHISDEMMDAALKLAQDKYEEENYPVSMSLFTLLTAFAPGTEEYWFRLGIAAQKSGQYSIALNAYHAACEINPQLVGAKLFSIECLLRENQRDEAMKLFFEIKSSTDRHPLEPIWQDFLNQVESALQK